MGTDGWLGIGWPAEFGGQGRGADAQFAFFDESFRAGAPLPMVTLTTVGPTLMAFGSPEQKARFLPGILAGEIVFAIGYTEPEAGTDLASLRTKTVRDGDEWVIDGEKVFTSGADGAGYIWLACRTDPAPVSNRGHDKALGRILRRAISTATGRRARRGRQSRDRDICARLIAPDASRLPLRGRR
jgi:alkylation response protein AidB-like acyl-CoA dehydrogenase